jgi:putative hydrolase of the HAD superfamily
MHTSQTTSIIDTIIWDADGVLFNTFDEYGQFLWSKTIVDDLKIDIAVLDQIFSGWDDVLRGTRDTRTHIVEALATSGSTIPPDDYITYWLEKDSSVNWEVAAYLSPAHDCIGTNQEPLRAFRIASQFAPRIRKIFASSAIGFLKPEEGYYRFIERELNLAPNQLCLIDDTARNVEAARSFGWTAHHYAGLATLRQFLTEHGHVHRLHWAGAVGFEPTARGRGRNHAAAVGEPVADDMPARNVVHPGSPMNRLDR